MLLFYIFEFNIFFFRYFSLIIATSIAEKNTKNSFLILFNND